MSFQDLVTNAQQTYPDLQIKYKDQSIFMKILGILLFFNKDFMTSYTTTIGSTVYFPTEKFVKARPVSTSVILLHELVHIHDSKKVSKPFFGFLYLFPQILILLCIPLFFFFWKVALILLILFALPLPAYFRMYYEKRAYMTSLYVINALSKRLSFNIDLNASKEGFLTQFKSRYYYFMWPFSNINKDFEIATQKISNGLRPFDDEVFETIDTLVKKV